MNFVIQNFDIKQEKKCIVCGKEIPKDRRFTMTCSTECSKIYRRIYDIARKRVKER